MIDPLLKSPRADASPAVQVRLRKEPAIPERCPGEVQAGVELQRIAGRGALFPFAIGGYIKRSSNSHVLDAFKRQIVVADRHRSSRRPAHTHAVETPGILISWLAARTIVLGVDTRKRLRRGTFHSVPALIASIHRYVREHNKDSRPFFWAASASSISRKITRCKEALETLRCRAVRGQA